MLLGIIYIYVQVGSTDYETLLNYNFNSLEQRLLGSLFLPLLLQRCLCCLRIYGFRKPMLKHQPRVPLF